MIDREIEIDACYNQANMRERSRERERQQKNQLEGVRKVSESNRGTMAMREKRPVNETEWEANTERGRQRSRKKDRKNGETET